MKNALITGATGYIGSNLARKLLRDGTEVHVIARTTSNFKLLKDIKDNLHVHFYDGSTMSLMRIFKKVRPDVVFHLASLYIAEHSTEDINRLIESNILFGTQLVEAMVKNNVYNLINVGTAWQHYKNKIYSPACLYAATKEAYEKILRFYSEALSFKVITLKLFDTYGPDDPRPKLMNILKDSCKKHNAVKMSPGRQLIDLVYIDDIVNAFALAGKRILKNSPGKMECFAVSSGKPLSLRKLVKLFESVSGEKLNITWGARAYRKREVMAPWNNGKIMPGWSLKVSLKDGLRKFIFNTNA